MRREDAAEEGARHRLCAAMRALAQCHGTAPVQGRGAHAVKDDNEGRLLQHLPCQLPSQPLLCALVRQRSAPASKHYR